MATHTQLTQGLVFSLLYVATVTSYASARVRGRTRLAWLDAPSCRLLARGAALVAIGLAAKLWHDIEPGPAAGFVVIVSLMVAGTLITLLGPMAPRVVWATALASLLAIPAFAFARGVLS